MRLGEVARLARCVGLKDRLLVTFHLSTSRSFANSLLSRLCGPPALCVNARFPRAQTLRFSEEASSLSFSPSCKPSSLESPQKCFLKYALHKLIFANDANAFLQV